MRHGHAQRSQCRKEASCRRLDLHCDKQGISLRLAIGGLWKDEDHQMVNSFCVTVSLVALRCDLIAEDREDSTFDNPSEHLFRPSCGHFCCSPSARTALGGSSRWHPAGLGAFRLHCYLEQRGLCITVLPIHAKLNSCQTRNFKGCMKFSIKNPSVLPLPLKPYVIVPIMSNASNHTLNIYYLTQQHKH